MNRSHIFAHTYQYLLYWYFKRLFSILLGINSYTFYSNIRPKNVSLFFLFSHTNQLLSIKFRKIYDLGWKQRLVCVILVMRVDEPNGLRSLFIKTAILIVFLFENSISATSMHNYIIIRTYVQLFFTIYSVIYFCIMPYDVSN